MLARRALVGAAVASCLAARAGTTAAARPSTAQTNVQVLPERLAMPGLARERTLRLYLPPSYATDPTRRYPVLYLQDGQNLFDQASAFGDEWGVDETLNALARTSGFEAITVGIDHGEATRLSEYSPWPHPSFGAGEGEAYLDFVVGVVKPFVDARWRTLTDAASTLIGGSSMGALISHVAIHRHPEVFGRALLFSPAYWIAPPLAEWVQQRPLPHAARLYFHVGGREGHSALPDAQRLHGLVARQGTAATALRIEPEARHDERAWRAAFGPAVQWLFERA